MVYRRQAVVGVPIVRVVPERLLKAVFRTAELPLVVIGMSEPRLRVWIVRSYLRSLPKRPHKLTFVLLRLVQLDEPLHAEKLILAVIRNAERPHEVFLRFRIAPPGQHEDSLVGAARALVHAKGHEAHASRAHGVPPCGPTRQF